MGGGLPTRHAIRLLPCGREIETNAAKAHGMIWHCTLGCVYVCYLCVGLLVASVVSDAMDKPSHHKFRAPDWQRCGRPSYRKDCNLAAVALSKNRDLPLRYGGAGTNCWWGVECCEDPTRACTSTTSPSDTHNSSHNDFLNYLIHQHIHTPSSTPLSPISKSLTHKLFYLFHHPSTFQIKCC
jgi:hypothetical protein